VKVSAYKNCPMIIRISSADHHGTTVHETAGTLLLTTSVDDFVGAAIQSSFSSISDQLHTTVSSKGMYKAVNENNITESIYMTPHQSSSSFGKSQDTLRLLCSFFQQHVGRLHISVPYDLH
jgi:hypothetical protein